MPWVSSYDLTKPGWYWVRWPDGEAGVIRAEAGANGHLRVADAEGHPTGQYLDDMDTHGAVFAGPIEPPEVYP